MPGVTWTDIKIVNGSPVQINPRTPQAYFVPISESFRCIHEDPHMSVPGNNNKQYYDNNRDRFVCRLGVRQSRDVTCSYACSCLRCSFSTSQKDEPLSLGTPLIQTDRYIHSKQLATSRITCSINLDGASERRTVLVLSYTWRPPNAR